MRQQLVWRRWFTAAICCWRRSRAHWLTLPSHSSAPAMEHQASLHQLNPDLQRTWCSFGHFQTFSVVIFSLRHQLQASKGNVRCHTVSETQVCCSSTSKYAMLNGKEHKQKSSYTCFVCGPFCLYREFWKIRLCSNCVNGHPVFCVLSMCCILKNSACLYIFINEIMEFLVLEHIHSESWKHFSGQFT